MLQIFAKPGSSQLIWRGACLFILVLLATKSNAGATVFVGVKSAQPISMDDIDHSAWDQLLQKYVNKNGRVDYQAFQRNAKDSAALDQYLAQLSNASASLPASRNARLAFWINAYNAVTIKGILREYPTSSIRNHTARLFGYNIWHDLQLYVGGTPYSLDQIEHKVLRKFGEPRIHFAIVCASVGCPRLLDRAYIGDQVDRQLESNAKDFFARPQNFVHEARDGRFKVSAILDWFAVDFGESQADQLRTIARWLPTEAAKAAARSGGVSVTYLDYDWNLNGQ